MIATIVIVSLALAWLGYETDWMRKRLSVGCSIKEIHTPKFEPMLCRNCNLSSRLHSWRTCHKDKQRWSAWQLPTRTIKVFGSTLNFTCGCNIQRALLLKEIIREQHKKTISYGLAPLPAFVETVRVGSRREWVETDDKGHGYHKIVEEYNTHYKDCIVPKGWLKKHKHDKLPEPTIDISIDGKSLSVNGDYKKGVIAGFMSEYTRKVKVGKKTMTITKEGHVENCGGGVYIAVNE